MASTTLKRDFTGARGAVYKWTYSFWVKRCSLGSIQVMTAPRHNGNFTGQIKFNSDDSLEVNDYRNSYLLQKKTNRKFRDVSAWYHIVVSNDNSVSSPDTKIYVNGVEETSFATDNEYSQNDTNSFNNDYPNYIGEKGTGDQFDGLMSHFHFIDGTAYAASTFGSTDATTGEWKLNTNPSVTYGTNGFFILKDGNSVTDQSGNSNNWSVDSGTLTKSEDCPSNNFATLNALSFHEANFSLSNGANTMTTGNNTQWNNAICATLAATGGKFYWEAKWTAGDNYSIIGILKAEDIHRCATSLSGSGTDIYQHANAIQTVNGGNPQKYSLVSANANIAHNISVNDILQFALDTENRKFFLGVNGTFVLSGNPATGANPTWDTTDIPADGEFVPYAQGYKISGSTSFQFNFGNGYFGTAAVSSAGTNASNNGIFEYDVPSGFTALSTKGLNL